MCTQTLLAANPAGATVEDDLVRPRVPSRPPPRNSLVQFRGSWWIWGISQRRLRGASGRSPEGM